MRKLFRKHEGVSTPRPKPVGRTAHLLLSILLMTGCLGLLFESQHKTESASALALANSVYLPLIKHSNPIPNTPIVHVPFIDDDNSFNLMESRYSELSVFWFGKVYKTENYTDVRLGYNRYHLVIDVASIDQQLWYESDAPSKNFSNWDSASIFLSIPGAGGESKLIRLDAGAALNKFFWKDRVNFQSSYQWDGEKWAPISFYFRTDHDYEGYFNESGEDEGWDISYHIPFSSLGLSDPPKSGSTLGLGVVVYDRDSASSSASNKFWPDGLQIRQAASYGQLTFGYPTFRRPEIPAAGNVTIKQSRTETVEDSSVGGSTTCGANGNNKWTEWGNRVYNNPPSNEVAVVQNQQGIDDWPCFSRYYVTFPLDRVPQGKVILSAKLTMMHFGGSSLSDAKPSYIQVMRVNQSWEPATTSWNNAPQAAENFPGTWVPPYNVGSSGLAGVARTWDVTQALSDIYGTGEPLRLALYSADRDMHSGKYFRSSETASWGANYPPVLTIEWGNP